MKYFFAVILLFISIGCAQKEELIVSNEVTTNQNKKTIVFSHEDRFGVDAVDFTENETWPDNSINMFSCEVNFAFDSYKIKSYECIKQYVDYLSNNYDNIIIQGNCDELGSEEYNYNLGLKRAKSVKNALIKMGVDSKRIAVESLGKTNPICQDTTKDCRSQNRRANFIITQNKN